MDNLRQDLRFAVRMLAKNPGFTAVAVLCIAFGIGTNVSAFSVASAILLRPFPYAEPPAPRPPSLSVPCGVGRVVASCRTNDPHPGQPQGLPLR